jgi:hypothetical protein
MRTGRPSLYTEEIVEQICTQSVGRLPAKAEIVQAAEPPGVS